MTCPGSNIYICACENIFISMAQLHQFIPIEWEKRAVSKFHLTYQQFLCADNVHCRLTKCYTCITKCYACIVYYMIRSHFPLSSKLCWTCRGEIMSWYCMHDNSQVKKLVLFLSLSLIARKKIKFPCPDQTLEAQEK